MSKEVQEQAHRYGAVINFDELDILVGRLLTYVDATFTDKEQREAHKSLIKQLIRGWYYDCEQDHPIKWIWENGEYKHINWDKKLEDHSNPPFSY